MTWYSIPLLIALLAPDAALHTRLARSEPAAGATVTTSPTELRLWFEGGVEPPFTQVALLAGSGARLALGAPAAGAEEGLVRVPVPLMLVRDTYTVRWETVGGDGHRISGEFRFTVAGDSGAAGVAKAEAPAGVDSTAWGAGAAGRTVTGPRVTDAGASTAAPTADSAGPSALARIVRWGELAGLVMALGGVAMLLLVLRTAHGSPAHERFLAAATQRVRAIALAASCGFLVLTGARFALESNTLHRGSGLSPAALGRTLGTAWGRSWSIAALAMLGLTMVLVFRRRGDAGPRHRAARGSDLALAAAGLLAAVGPALTGHAGNAAALLPFAVLTDWLHVVGASAWIGGVALLALAGAPAALAQPPADRAPSLAWMVSAFHALAAPAIMLVGVSGVVAGWLRVGTWEALTRTNYGDLLLFKVYVVAFAALMGAYHWYRVHPRLVAATAARDREARNMSWTLYLELVAGLLVLALTAALVTLAPPR